VRAIFAGALPRIKVARPIEAARWIEGAFMRIAVASDLHLEFSDIELAGDGADVVVLAGDIHVRAEGVRWAAGRFDVPVIYVAGNHEFYDGDIVATTAAMRDAARGTNVHLLDDEAVTIGGVRFLGAVLWTDFDLFGDAGVKADAIARCLDLMPDFKIITNGPGVLTPEDTVAIHAKSRAWLAAALADGVGSGPTVVVTHHAPHRGSLAPRYAEDPVSAAFVSDLAPLMDGGAGAPPALWVHGHTHTSFDYTVGTTRVVCNPRGYSRRPGGHRENPAFRPDFVVEI
jgi:predicted phosphodiesterase